MVLINGNWEQVKNFDDVLRIVRENIGDEFAKEVERIGNEPDEDLQDRIWQLENDLEELELGTEDYDDIQNRLEELNDNLDKLYKYVEKYECKDKLDDQYVKGMMDAYKMIYN